MQYASAQGSKLKGTVCPHCRFFYSVRTLSKYVTLKLKIKFPTHPCFDRFSHPQTYKTCAPTDADWQLDSHSDMV